MNHALRTAINSLLISGLIVLSLQILLTNTVSAQGTWTKVTTQSPHHNFGGLLLLSDGTALCKSYEGGCYGSVYDRLTPDSTGSYVNGTWSSIAAMHKSRLYYSS